MSTARGGFDGLDERVLIRRKLLQDQQARVDHDYRIENVGALFALNQVERALACGLSLGGVAQSFEGQSHQT